MAREAVGFLVESSDLLWPLEVERRLGKRELPLAGEMLGSQDTSVDATDED